MFWARVKVILPRTVRRGLKMTVRGSQSIFYHHYVGGYSKDKNKKKMTGKQSKQSRERGSG